MWVLTKPRLVAADVLRLWPANSPQLKCKGRVENYGTVVSYQNESFSSKWELPCLPPSSLEICRKERARRQLSFWWKTLILIGHYRIRGVKKTARKWYPNFVSSILKRSHFLIHIGWTNKKMEREYKKTISSILFQNTCLSEWYFEFVEPPLA